MKKLLDELDSSPEVLEAVANIDMSKIKKRPVKKKLHPFDEFDICPNVDNFYKWVKSIRDPKKVFMRKYTIEYKEGRLEYSIGKRKISDTAF